MSLLKKVRISNISLISLLLVLPFLTPSFSPASENINVTGVRYWSYPGYTRVVIDLSGISDFTKKRLYKPDRLYFDINNSMIKKEVQTDISIDNGMLKSVRTGQFTKSTVRVVLDLEKFNNYKVFTLEDPSRIVVDIYGQTIFSSKKRIVIDPGHGGKDPGAVGPKKLYEKDVVLDIALKLKKMLSKDKDYEVFLTRDKDIFVSLEERTAIANSKNADLFVSVHANASPRKKLKGIETYFRNWTDNEEWMKVAARENAITLKQMKKIQKKSLLETMLNELRIHHNRDESLALANYVQKSMINTLNRNYKHIVDLGVKWAPFFVFYGAEMPSVLVEVSFISNPLEAKMLRKDRYRNDLARSIASGIIKYMSSMAQEQTIADSRKTIAPRD